MLGTIALRNKSDRAPPSWTFMTILWALVRTKHSEVKFGRDLKIKPMPITVPRGPPCFRGPPPDLYHTHFTH